jgi:hypothetical protein
VTVLDRRSGGLQPVAEGAATRIWSIDTPHRLEQVLEADSLSLWRDSLAPGHRILAVCGPPPRVHATFAVIETRPAVVLALLESSHHG